MKIGNQVIGPDHKPFIIAEMSGNHNQSLDRALKIVEMAAKNGAHAIKLQTYTADTMTLKIDRSDFIINNPNSLWHGRHLYELYQEAYTPWEWHAAILERAKQLGILGFSTPYDETAVDFLETLNVPCYKIASFENTDVRLLKKVAQTGKPVIVSTGMASISELQGIVETLNSSGCVNYVLLKCTSAYPASPADANLRTIPHMAAMFNCQVGLSDHTMGVGVALAAVALGATVIEKHFCLSRGEGGIDSAFSLEPHELKELVEESEKAWQALGKVNYIAEGEEKKSLAQRRSLYFIKNMQSGEVITHECIQAIRPGFGLPVKYWDDIIGKKVTKEIAIGDRVSWELLN